MVDYIMPHQVFFDFFHAHSFREENPLERGGGIQFKFEFFQYMRKTHVLLSENRKKVCSSLRIHAFFVKYFFV